MKYFILALALLLLSGCSFSPSDEDRHRLEDLTQQLRQINQKLEEYKGRIDELNAQLKLLNKLQGAK